MIAQRLSIGVDEAVARLLSSIAEAPLALVAHIDGQANAARRGIEVPADQLLEVFRPDFAARVWAADKRAGIDIPLRIHVYDAEGTTVVAHRPPSEIFRPYANPELDAVAADLAPLFGRVFASLQSVQLTQ